MADEEEDWQTLQIKWIQKHGQKSLRSLQLFQQHCKQLIDNNHCSVKTHCKFFNKELKLLIDIKNDEHLGKKNSFNFDEFVSNRQTITMDDIWAVWILEEILFIVKTKPLKNVPWKKEPCKPHDLMEKTLLCKQYVHMYQAFLCLRDQMVLNEVCTALRKAILTTGTRLHCFWVAYQKEKQFEFNQPSNSYNISKNDWRAALIFFASNFKQCRPQCTNDRFVEMHICAGSFCDELELAYDPKKKFDQSEREELRRRVVEKHVFDVYRIERVHDNSKTERVYLFKYRDMCIKVLQYKKRKGFDKWYGKIYVFAPMQQIESQTIKNLTNWIEFFTETTMGKIKFKIVQIQNPPNVNIPAMLHIYLLYFMKINAVGEREFNLDHPAVAYITVMSECVMIRRFLRRKENYHLGVFQQAITKCGYGTKKLHKQVNGLLRNLLISKDITETLQKYVHNAKKTKNCEQLHAYYCEFMQFSLNNMDQFAFGQAPRVVLKELQIENVEGYAMKPNSFYDGAYLNIPKKKVLMESICCKCASKPNAIVNMMCVVCGAISCALHSAPVEPYKCLECWKNDQAMFMYNVRSGHLTLVTTVLRGNKHMCWLYDQINGGVVTKSVEQLCQTEIKSLQQYARSFGMQCEKLQLRVSVSNRHTVKLNDGCIIAVKKVKIGQLDPGILILSGCVSALWKRQQYHGLYALQDFMLNKFSECKHRIVFKEIIGNAGWYENDRSTKFILSSMMTVKKAHMDHLDQSLRKRKNSSYQLGIEPSDFNLLQTDDSIGWKRDFGLGIFNKLKLVNDTLIALGVIKKPFPFNTIDIMANTKNYTGHHDFGMDDCERSELHESYAGLVILYQVRAINKYCTVLCKKRQMNREFGEFEIKTGEILVLYNAATSRFQHSFNCDSKEPYYCIQARHVRIQELLKKLFSDLQKRELRMLINYIAFELDPKTEGPFRCSNQAIIDWIEKKFDGKVTDNKHFRTILKEKQRYLNGTRAK